MSRHGVIVWSVTHDSHLLIHTPDTDTGLIHAKRLARELGYREPVNVTTIVLDDDPDTDAITTSAIEPPASGDGWTHQEVVHWVLGNENYDGSATVGQVLQL